MSVPVRPILIGCAVVVIVLAISTAWVAGAMGSSAAHPSSHPEVTADWKTLPGETLVAAPPPGDSQPDDIAWLPAGGLDHGRTLIWTSVIPRSRAMPSGQLWIRRAGRIVTSACSCVPTGLCLMGTSWRY